MLKVRMRWAQPTLFLEIIISLETAAKAIEGLTRLSDPKPNCIHCSSQSSHDDDDSGLIIDQLLQ